MIPRLLLPFLLLASACNTPSYRAVSSADQRKLAAQTLSADEGKERLYGENALRLGFSGDETATLPFRYVNRCPHIAVAVNGARPAPFLLDTGAAISAIEARTAIRHGVPLFDSSLIPAKAKGIGGEETVRVGYADLGLSRLTLHNVPLFVRTHRNEVRILGPLITESLHTDILGINPLGLFCNHLTIDYPRQQVTFATRGSYKPASGTRVIKLKRLHNLPCVTLRVGDVSWDAIIDTGSSFGIEITHDIAKRLNVEKDSVPVLDSFQYGIGGSVDTADAGIRHAVLPRLEGLGPALKDVGIGIRPDMSLIGSYFLRHFRVTFDFRRGLLYLER